MKKIPMDNCQWCKGSGREDGYLPCPDCEGTGLKYGREAEQYFDELMDIVCEWNDNLKDILVETFGFPEKRFIPKDVETFVMNYFGSEEKMPPKEEVRTFMLEEIGAEFFTNCRPYVFGHEFSDGRLYVYTSLLSPPEPIWDESKFFKSRESDRFDFLVSSDDALSFLKHTDATELGDGVFAFSKEAWKDFPKSIQLHTDTPIHF